MHCEKVQRLRIKITKDTIALERIFGGKLPDTVGRTHILTTHIRENPTAPTVPADIYVLRLYERTRNTCKNGNAETVRNYVGEKKKIHALRKACMYDVGGLQRPMTIF